MDARSERRTRAFESLAGIYAALCIAEKEFLNSFSCFNASFWPNNAKKVGQDLKKEDETDQLAMIAIIFCSNTK